MVREAVVMGADGTPKEFVLVRFDPVLEEVDTSEQNIKAITELCKQHDCTDREIQYAVDTAYHCLDDYDTKGVNVQRVQQALIDYAPIYDYHETGENIETCLYYDLLPGETLVFNDQLPSRGTRSLNSTDVKWNEFDDLISAKSEEST